MYVNQFSANRIVLAASITTTSRELIARTNSRQRASAVIKTASSTNDHSTRWASTCSGGTSETSLKYKGINPHRPYAKIPYTTPFRDSLGSMVAMQRSVVVLSENKARLLDNVGLVKVRGDLAAPIASVR